MSSRVPSGSIVIPKGAEPEATKAQYPPDDARAMSPRRESADLARLGQEARETLKR
jgi:short coiled-coil protein